MPREHWCAIHSPFGDTCQLIYGEGLHNDMKGVMVISSEVMVASVDEIVGVGVSVLVDAT